MTTLQENNGTKRKFCCIPIAAGLPAIYLCATIVSLLMAWQYWQESHDIEELMICLTIAFFSLISALFFFFPAIRRVEIKQDVIVCKGFLPKNRFEIEYSKCNVGMDYHCQYKKKIWWIYLCYGSAPQYKLNNPANRMNAIKIQPGFVKIMYSDEVYNSLLDVLPKKQQTALVTARRCAGFEKQDNIIL